MTPLIVFIVSCALVLLFLAVGQPLWSLLNVPRQLAHLWQGDAVRRNHAIEHATVNVLRERYGFQVLDGYATREGFCVRALVEPALLLDAAREALLRLQRNDRALAIYSRCATTLATTYAALASLLMLLLLTTNTASLLNAALAAILAAFAAPAVSRLIQRWITTSLDVKGMSIGGIELLQPRFALGLALAGGAEFAIHTKSARRVSRPPYRFGERVPVYVPVEKGRR